MKIINSTDWQILLKHINEKTYFIDNAEKLKYDAKWGLLESMMMTMLTNWDFYMISSKAIRPSIPWRWWHRQMKTSWIPDYDDNDHDAQWGLLESVMMTMSQNGDF